VLVVHTLLDIQREDKLEEEDKQFEEEDKRSEEEDKRSEEEDKQLEVEDRLLEEEDRLLEEGDILMVVDILFEEERMIVVEDMMDKELVLDSLGMMVLLHMLESTSIFDLYCRRILHSKQ